MNGQKKIKVLSRRKKILLGVLVFMILFAAGPFIYVALATDPDGKWNPDSYYQRYRGAEYSSNSNFFQWWYFSLKDYQTGESFAIAYILSRPAENQTYRGCYVSIAYVNNSGTFHMNYRYPLESLQISNYYDLNISQGCYLLEPLTPDHLHLSGMMNQTTNVWLPVNISPESNISWNLDIYRIVGWYGQHDIEGLIKSFSLITWNTFSYDSEVEGTIQINSSIFSFSRNSRYRIYCDMNWGEEFPTGDPAIEYMWGWFYTGKPNADPTRDLSIIAGVGRSVASLPLVSPMYAKFASIYLRGERKAAREARILDFIPDHGPRILHRAPDGDCQLFQVEQSNWATYNDIFGSAQIPLTQIITIETISVKIIMTFHSNVTNYNRLLVPTDGYCFSDFEGLGVNCTTVIYSKTYSSWDVAKWYPSYDLNETVFDANAGIEYGYKLDVFL